MRILLVSDSHGNCEALDKLLKKYPNMDLYLHAGDLEADEQSIRPFDCVKGNCDHYSRLPERRIIHTPYGALLMTHLPYLPLSIAKEYNVKIFIYGHTHRRKFELVDGIYYINPGAISFPRDGFDLSYAIVEITPEKVDVEFKSLLD